MKLLIGAAVAAVTILSASAGSAATFNFDGLAASTNTSGAPNNAASVLTTNFASQGIVFGKAGVSAGVAVIRASSAARSGSNGISGLSATGGLTRDVAGNIYFNFVDTLNSAVAATTNSVSFWIGDDGGDVDSFIISAFGIGGGLLQSLNVSGESHQFVEFSFAGINSIEVINTTGTTFGYLLDDLSFNTPGSEVSPVPLPGSLPMVAGAIALLGFVRRKART